MKFVEDYHGMSVRLTDDRMSHLRSHPNISGLEPAIVKTLQEPEKVLETLRDSEAKGAYRFYLGAKLGERRLCLVVRIREDDALFVTAFLAERNIGGFQIWPRKDE